MALRAASAAKLERSHLTPIRRAVLDSDWSPLGDKSGEGAPSFLADFRGGAHCSAGTILTRWRTSCGAHVSLRRVCRDVTDGGAHVRRIIRRGPWLRRQAATG